MSMFFRMKTKRKLFVRFFHESNFELPIIEDLETVEFSVTPLYQMETLSYIRKGGNLSSSSRSSPAHNNEKRCDTDSENCKIGSNLSPEILKPNFFSFLDHKLENVDLVINNTDSRIKDISDDQSSREESFLPNNSSGDFLSWLGDKLKNRSDPCDESDEWGIELPKNGDNVCTICGKMYTTKNGLNYHMILHSGIYPYKCKHCMQAFKSSSTLHRHIRSIHDKQKPFKCKECQKSFIQKSNLDKHMDSHYGIRRFNCYICLKAFFQKCHLNNHLLTHSKKKQYKCLMCGTKFVKRFCLDRHMKNMHQI
jgi:hypothetical protein